MRQEHSVCPLFFFSPQIYTSHVRLLADANMYAPLWLPIAGNQSNVMFHMCKHMQANINVSLSQGSSQFQRLVFHICVQMHGAAPGSAAAAAYAGAGSCAVLGSVAMDVYLTQELAQPSLSARQQRRQQQVEDWSLTM